MTYYTLTATRPAGTKGRFNTRLAGLFLNVRQRLAGRFMRNVGWLAGAQLASRVLRLFSTVIVARLLLPADFGMVAIVLAASEFVQMFYRQGTGAKLIQAHADDVEPLAKTAYWMNWLQCSTLFVLQCLIAFPLSRVYDNPDLVLPLCVMALSYLMLPNGLVHSALNIRANRLHVSATAETLQTAADVVLTVILALQGLGFWALVIPKVLVTPIWIIVHYRAQDWQRPRIFTFDRWREIFHFSLKLVGVEILATLRNNMDYLLVGYFLGIQALGVYFFAFNAGLGISLSLIRAFGTALFPHLCAANNSQDELRRNFRSGLKIMAWITLPLVLCQAVLAPWYLPIVFGAHWLDAGALPVLILICLSALPRPFAEAAAQLLRTVDKTEFELRWNIALTLMLLAGVLAGVHWGVNGVATAVLLVHLILLPLFIYQAINVALGERLRYDSNKQCATTD